MLQQTEWLAAKDNSLTRPDLTSPEQIARIKEVCQRLKIKSLDQIEFLPKSYNFLVELTPESKQRWSGHYTGLLESIQAELGDNVEFVTPDAYQKVAKEAPQNATVIQRIYPNG